MDLATDHDGFLWIATQQGLIRYDGYTFRRYTHDSDNPASLAEDYIQTLKVTSDGRIWIGTSSKGVSIYDPKTDSFTSLAKLSDRQSLTSRILSIAENTQGEIFLGSTHGLFKYIAQQEAFEPIGLLSPTDELAKGLQILSLSFDDRENLWVGSNKGLFVLPAGKLQMLAASAFKVKASDVETFDLLSRDIKALKFMADGRLWLGTRKSGAGVIDLNTRQLTKLRLPYLQGKPKAINAIEQVSDDELWLGMYNEGVYRINLHDYGDIELVSNNNAQIGSISGNKINSIEVDASGVIWVGTRGNGLNKYLPNEAFVTKYIDVDNTKHLFIRDAFQTTDGTLWLGTDKGLRRYNLDSGDLSAFIAHPDSVTDLSQSTVVGLGQIDDQHLWLSTKQGLYTVSLENNMVEKVNTASVMANTLIAEGKDKLWLSSAQYLYRLELNTMEMSRFYYQNQQGVEEDISTILPLLKDNRGRVWLGSFRGLFVLEPGAEHLIKVTDVANQYTFDGTIALALKDDTLWFSNASGLFSLALNSLKDGKASVKKAPLKVTRANDRQFSNLQIDSQGRLWEASLMYDPISEQTFEFGRADGVDVGADWVGSFGKLSDGRMAFGGSQGLLITTPEAFTPWQYLPPIRLTDFQIDRLSRTVDSAGIVEISPEVKSISMDFAALDYSAPELVNYRYQLVGFDQDWVTTNPKKRSVTYTNLSPGNYSLIVQATNRTGFWTAETTLITFQVLPAFYQTWWFRTLMLLMLILTLYLLVRWRVKKLSEQERIQNEIVLASERAALMEELVEKKNQLLADVSHELRTPLTVLQLKVEALQNNLVKDVGASYDSLMSKIGEINCLISDIYQLAQSDIGALHLEPRSHNCLQTFSCWADEIADAVAVKGFTWQQSITLTPSCCATFDHDKIKQVINNLVDNSMAYTDLPGSISFTVKEVRKGLEVVIEDSAPGVSKVQFASIFERLYRVETSRSRATGGSGLGLSICKSIVEAHKGTITASGSPLGGLAITIYLPMQAN
ncbi:hypothetical protein K0J45_16030 [Shewanella alkalitolerans]|uniref:two-component regulator propeller domain-containing protein n=1 Tax=Shewanella alkalitolerans TaxID=2864209 RepID=UPI001C65A391|nr:two-component regulator propeller domain-containing protein [Shewanella alkalitolerans]QYJ97006.1 hypothetical protein K0J45_16030 [Shewanella alkalitolerans]